MEGKSQEKAPESFAVWGSWEKKNYGRGGKNPHKKKKRDPFSRAPASGYKFVCWGG